MRSAWTLVEHNILIYKYPTQSTVFMMPGMSFLLALFVLVFGKFSGLIAFRVFQVLLQTISLILIFHIARKVLNRKVAVLAVFLDALYIPEIWVTNLILTEVTFKFLLLCLIYLSGLAIQKRRVSAYVWVGVVWSIATLFRPTIALYVGILPILWWYSKYSLKEATKYSLVISVVFIALMSPWWIRNYQVFHKFIPLTLASGNPMLQGTYIGGDKSSEATDGIDYSAYYNYSDNEIEVDRMEKALAIERLKTLVPENPLGYLYWYTVGKTFYQWYVPFLLNNLDYSIILVATGFHWLLLIGFIVGLVKLRFREQNAWLILILLVLSYFNCMHLPFISYARYMYPVIPLMIIISAYGFLNMFGYRHNILHSRKPTPLADQQLKLKG
ncbi:MAG TPA: glycosyltransferase family 39 protein [Desulfosporosinus sp.]|nr:glycosyltransferase family 39 protein [Desulfosporosinus sp.]